MKICNACGDEFEDTFRFCPVDGLPLRKAMVAEFEEAVAGERCSTGRSEPQKKEFELTLMESGHLTTRLSVEIRYLQDEIKQAWPEFRRDPLGFGLRSAGKGAGFLKRQILVPNVATGILTSCLIVTSIVLGVFVLEKHGHAFSEHGSVNFDDPAPEMIDLAGLKNPDKSKGVGLTGKGRVGFQRDKGEGSSPQQQRAQGGGSGGNRSQFVAQVGKLPQPSLIPAAIPNLPPINKTTLPAAGIDIDPDLWHDIKAPVYGDPRSRSQVPSNGQGVGGGMGTNEGTGIGDGKGPGVGPGEDGNIGGGPRRIGGPRPGGGSGNNPDPDRVWPVREVEQRARLLSKPEPQYSEEARRNQITGTVVLRVVFSSTGEVSNIRAVSLLPFGLTERAIAAARQIRFVPATRGGLPVSVYMQLEYNFNLY